MNGENEGVVCVQGAGEVKGRKGGEKYSRGEGIEKDTIEVRERQIFSG